MQCPIVGLNLTYPRSLDSGAQRKEQGVGKQQGEECVPHLAHLSPLTILCILGVPGADSWGEMK